MLNRSVCLLLMLMLCFSEGLWAHGLNLFVAVEGDLIRGRVSFGDAHSAGTAVIKISNEDGDRLAVIKPEEDGSFIYQVVSQQDHLITADSQDGHVMKRWIKAEMLHGHAADNQMIGDETMLDLRLQQIVAHQITPLREELAAYQAQIRLRDILGGLGYIIGLAGLAFWLKGHKPA